MASSRDNVPTPESSRQGRARDPAVPQLRFITMTNPEEERDSRTRKIVRSHAAKQHYVGRQQAWEQEEGGGEGEEIEGSASETQVMTRSEQEAQEQHLSMIPRRSGSLVTAIGPGSSDPFSSTSLQVTPRTNVLIDHFLTIVGPGMNAFVSTNSSLDLMKTIYIPFSIADPCVFHGLLLLSARSFAKVSFDASYHITALTHKAECIRLVNEALGIPRKQTSDAIIAAVLMLAVEENEKLMLGNLTAFKAHLIGVQTMISIRGGIDNLGLAGILKQLALSCDRACEMFTGSEPLFGEPTSGDELPAPTSLPPGFQQIARSLEANSKVASFIDQAKTSTLIKMFSGYEGTTDAELQFSDRHCNSIAQHLEHMSTQFMIPDNSDSPSHSLLEECLCYGLLAYRMIMLRSIPPDPRLSLDVGNRLKSALMRTELHTHWLGHEELLLWISFVGAHTTIEDPLRNWYVVVLDGVCSHLGYRSWEDVRNSLKRFLWIERCEMLGRTLWGEVEMFTANKGLAGEQSRIGFDSSSV